MGDLIPFPDRQHDWATKAFNRAACRCWRTASHTINTTNCPVHGNANPRKSEPRPAQPTRRF